MGTSEPPKRSKSRTPEPQQDQAEAVPGRTPDSADVPAQGFGAAASCLTNPACKPGTEEFAAAQVKNGQLLQQYREKKEAHEANRVGGVF